MIEYQLICYRNKWIADEVYKYSAKISSKVTDTSIVENRIMQAVGKYLTEDVTRIKNRAYILKMIQREAYAALKRNRNEHAVHFADIGYEDDTGEIIEYEPTDVLANVESDFSAKETITLLAKDDRKRSLILNAWANGFTNDKALSETLASFFGGQARSHRIYIQRFRIECRTTLRPTAI